ncbi:glycoside hydrolase family 10 [Opitutus terrae PB90-1]|uniref:Beta-xylanase n=2 Tax=Opitutus terrae TaxID=107709 RepID=B1ZXI4_OPITP|nr:glycoside hydrolase family 10 [Opitutus terrae PB90-1]
MTRSLGALVGGLMALVVATPWLRAADDVEADRESIRRHRMGTLVVHTVPGATVQVEQVKHEFWFGAALANQAFDGRMPAADRERYLATFLENFNAAVTENALKWMAMEPKRGERDYATVDAILAWADQHEVPLRGHNLYWGVPKWTQAWIKELDDAMLRQTIEERARDIGRRYRGRFAEYDLNNEMIHGNYYADRLGPRVTLDMAQWIKAEDPSARLFVNDYDILTGRRLADYLAHIRELLAMGVPIDGIGVQGHLHGDTFDAAALRSALDELAQFHLPIRVTEFNFPGQRSKFYQQRELAITAEEEDAKGRAIADYYRICFAHPAVDGVLMWGYWEGANWIPQASLYKQDWKPTPALKAYRDLVFGEWWTRWEGKADESGRCVVPAFFGRHLVRAAGQQRQVELAKRHGIATVDFR